MVSEVDSHIEKGKHLLLTVQDPGAALDEFSRALAVDPTSVVAFVFRHFAYSDLKMWSRSIADLNQAIRLSPDDYRLFSYRAEVKVASRDYEGAYQDLCQAMLMDDSMELVWLRGYVCLMLHRNESAIQDFSHVLTFTPADGCARNNRGLAYLQNNMVEEALADFNKAIELNPEHPDHYNSRARLFAQIGEDEKARIDSEAALECCDRVFDPKLSDDAVWNDRAEALVRLGRHKEAIETCKNVLRIRADDAEAYRFIGEALAGMDKIEEALKSLDKSIALDRDPQVIKLREKIAQRLSRD